LQSVFNKAANQSVSIKNATRTVLGQAKSKGHPTMIVLKPLTGEFYMPHIEFHESGTTKYAMPDDQKGYLKPLSSNETKALTYKR